MQQCYECGRETPLGEPLRHFDGCEHLTPAQAGPDPVTATAWPYGEVK